MKKPLSHPVHRLDTPTAEVLAAEALDFLAQDPDRLARFFAETGLAPADLRATASVTGFAASLIDHLASDETAFVAFARHSGRDPAALDALRRTLSPEWTDP